MSGSSSSSGVCSSSGGSTSSRLKLKKKEKLMPVGVDSERDLAIEKYMRLAKDSRTISTTKAKGMTQATSSFQQLSQCDLDSVKIVNISCGQMVHNSALNRGVMQKKHTMIKLPIKITISYDELLSILVKKFWPQKDGDTSLTHQASFYLADGSGCKIGHVLEWEGDQVTWNLQNYLKLSGIKFPSRFRVYCVKELQAKIVTSIDMPRVASYEETTTSSTLDEFVPNKRSPSHCSSALIAANPPQTPSLPIKESAEIDTPPLPNGYFFIEFMELRRSKYASKYITVTGLSQKDILGSKIEEDDPDTAYEVQQSLLQEPNVPCRLFVNNPCHFGFTLYSIDDYANPDHIIKLVEDVCLSSGTIKYKSNVADGVKFSVWSGCYSTPWDRVAVMASVAENGYHGRATYAWQFNDDSTMLEAEEFPILYTNKPGKYKATVKIDTGEELSCSFVVAESDAEELVVHKVHAIVPECTEMAKNLSSDSIAETAVVKKVLDCHTETANDLLPSHMVAVQPDSNLERSTVMKIGSSCMSFENVTLLDVVGRGSYGTVYEAVWRGTIVAVKLLHIGTHFKDDCAFDYIRQINHPNILSLMGIVEVDGSIGLVTQFIRGRDLKTCLFDEEKIIKFDDLGKKMLIVKICQGLVYLHTNVPPIVHLDVKPSNIMIDEITMNPYITDFGLTQIMKQQASSHLTSTLSLGTPGYMALELIMHQEVNVKADVYSLGCVIVEVYGGTPIWKDLTPFQIIYKVTVKGNKPNSGHIDEYVRGICDSCMNSCIENCPSSSQLLTKLLELNIPMQQKE